MVCSRCAATVAASDHFCENCGAILGESATSDKTSGAQRCHCPSGESRPDEAGFCQVCGARCLSEAAAARKHSAIAVDERLAVVSDIGRRHAVNEDFGAVQYGADGSVLLVVADGVSSALDSATASEVATRAALSVLVAATATALDIEIARQAVMAAHQATLTLPDEPGKADGPETTIVAALCRQGQIAIGWAGDSRAYLIREDTQIQLTVDDSWIEQVVKAGMMTQTEATADKRSHYVTQVLGMRDQALDPHALQRDLPHDCLLLICSDGLWNYFQDEGALAAAVKHYHTGDALTLCQALVDAANNGGGHDNITVAILLPAPIDKRFQ